MANRNGQDGISTKEAIGAPGEQRGETHNDLCEICFKDVVGCICKPPQPLAQEPRPLPVAIPPKFKHVCPEWDGLEIDETWPEFEACLCFRPKVESHPLPAQPANLDSNRKPSFDWEEFYRLAWKDKIARKKKKLNTVELIQDSTELEGLVAAMREFREGSTHKLSDVDPEFKRTQEARPLPADFTDEDMDRVEKETAHLVREGLIQRICELEAQLSRLTSKDDRYASGYNQGREDEALDAKNHGSGESAEDAWKRGIELAAKLACQYWGSSFGVVITDLLKTPYAPPISPDKEGQ